MFMLYIFSIIILIIFVLFFYTKGIILTIQFKKKYNIKTSTSSVEIISHILVYTFSLVNIGICVWALFNI